MASLVSRLRRLCSGGSKTRYECRQCGTSLEAAVEACPECESGEIATYRIAN